jgi:hypothetical protein
VARLVLGLGAITQRLVAERLDVVEHLAAVVEVVADVEPDHERQRVVEAL